MDPLSFRCTGCGNCCRTLRVAVTASDLARLAHATGKQAGELVDWLTPDAVDMTGEPSSFVDLSEGRRLMVLAHGQGGCGLLGGDDRCTAYAARPLDCRAFPFDFAAASPAPRRRLSLLPLDGCLYERDGEHHRQTLEEVDARRWQELAAYQARVGEWNRLAKQRRRLGHRIGAADSFLRFALA